MFDFFDYLDAKRRDDQKVIVKTTTIHGRVFDPVNDPALVNSGIIVAAVTTYNQTEGVRNRIVFHGPDGTGAVGCVHTAIYSTTLDKMPGEKELARSTEFKQVKLPPEEHFFALRSYVQGVLDFGICNMMGATYQSNEWDPSNLPFGFNALMQQQILFAITKTSHDASDALLLRFLRDLGKTVDKGWLDKRYKRFTEIYATPQTNNVAILDALVDLFPFREEEIVSNALSFGAFVGLSDRYRRVVQWYTGMEPEEVRENFTTVFDKAAAVHVATSVTLSNRALWDILRLGNDDTHNMRDVVWFFAHYGRNISNDILEKLLDAASLIDPDLVSEVVKQHGLPRGAATKFIYLYTNGRVHLNGDHLKTLSDKDKADIIAAVCASITKDDSRWDPVDLAVLLMSVGIENVEEEALISIIAWINEGNTIANAYTDTSGRLLSRGSMLNIFVTTLGKSLTTGSMKTMTKRKQLLETVLRMSRDKVVCRNAMKIVDSDFVLKQCLWDPFLTIDAIKVLSNAKVPIDPEDMAHLIAHDSPLSTHPNSRYHWSPESVAIALISGYMESIPSEMIIELASRNAAVQLTLIRTARETGMKLPDKAVVVLCASRSSTVQFEMMGNITATDVNDIARNGTINVRKLVYKRFSPLLDEDALSSVAKVADPSMLKDMLENNATPDRVVNEIIHSHQSLGYYSAALRRDNVPAAAMKIIVLDSPYQLRLRNVAKKIDAEMAWWIITHLGMIEDKWRKRTTATKASSGMLELLSHIAKKPFAGGMCRELIDTHMTNVYIQLACNPATPMWAIEEILPRLIEFGHAFGLMCTSRAIDAIKRRIDNTNTTHRLLAHKYDGRLPRSF